MELDLDSPSIVTLTRLSMALVAGSLVGLERTYHGGPAGFRTHALVCAASSLLVLVTVFYKDLIPDAPQDTIRLDPTRMAQGIMTGIGFLGAGVIIKESMSVRGLTTAASIWITASIGIAIGMGLYFAALVAEVFVLGTLSTFRWVEGKMPTLLYGRLTIRFASSAQPSEAELTQMIAEHDITAADSSYQLEGDVFQYEMTVHTRNAENYRKLSDTLRMMEGIEFSIALTGKLAAQSPD